MAKDVAKAISKLNKVVHPKSRKAVQLTKKTLKAAGREKVKQQNQVRLNITGEKYLWFKEHLEPVENYTPELLSELIQKYFCRFDEELEQIELKHSTGKRKGRQHASREDIIKMTIKNEMNEFNTCGIELPDILNPKQLNLLKNWSGELRFLQNFKTVRYSKSKLESLKNSRKNKNTENNSKSKSENNTVKESKPEESVQKKESEEDKDKEEKIDEENGKEEEKQVEENKEEKMKVEEKEKEEEKKVGENEKEEKVEEKKKGEMGGDSMEVD